MEAFVASEENSKYVVLVGRILLSFIFVLSGLGKLFQFNATAGMMSAKGLPVASFLLLGAIAFELFGGLSVLTGFKTRLGAILLIIFLVPVTLVFHNFWAYQGMDQQMQMANFLKNVGLAGGLALVAVFGPGPVSVDKK
jgi:putative oxidoreductase